MSILKSFISVMGRGVVVSLDAAYDVYDQWTFPSTATASIELRNDGTIVGSGNLSGGGYQGDWITPSSAAGGNYEARWTNTDGTLSSGTAGTWQALSTTRQWAVSQILLGTNFCTGTLEVRHAVTLSVLSSKSITLTAEVL